MNRDATHLSFPHVAVISDLHVADPHSGPPEDFDRDAEFRRLLLEYIPANVGWPATLVIAGDFIDFPQVLPELARHPYGDRFGTTEAESLQRIERVVTGHPDVFAAMREFIARGGEIRLLPGNHDVDYHWPAVEARLHAAIGDPDAAGFTFVREGAISERGVYIEHGNQYAFDNRFEHWDRPILRAPDGERLERPWGTLFMDLVYNDAETAYPFVNKLYPHAELAVVVARSLVRGQVSIPLVARIVAFMLRKGKRFAWERLLGQDDRVDAVRLGDVPALVGALLPDLDGPVADALIREVEQALGEPAVATPEVLPGLLGRNDDAGMTRRATELLRLGAASIVVFGHTHVIVDGHAPFGVDDPRRVYNTGCWMPQISIAGLKRPTIADVARQGATRHALRFLALELTDPPRARLESL